MLKGESSRFSVAANDRQAAEQSRPLSLPYETGYTLPPQECRE